MSDFSKKLKKTFGSNGNAVIYGPDRELLESFSKVFYSVFVFGVDSSLLRSKNIIYRSGTDMTNLPEIRLIQIDENGYQFLLENLSFLRLTRCDVMIMSRELPSELLMKEMMILGYILYDQGKRWQLWKVRN